LTPNTQKNFTHVSKRNIMCRVKHKGEGITEINKGVEGGKPRAGPNFGDALARVQKLFKMEKTPLTK
jgi:hypothetical protein